MKGFPLGDALKPNQMDQEYSQFLSVTGSTDRLLSLLKGI